MKIAEKKSGFPVLGFSAGRPPQGGAAPQGGVAPAGRGGPRRAGWLNRETQAFLTRSVNGTIIEKS